MATHWHLIRDQADRDEIAHAPALRGRQRRRLGRLIDTLTMYPDVRRQVVRLLAEIDATALEWPVRPLSARRDQA